MIKKFVVVATFAASMIVGVPSASANSPFLCMQQYEVDLIACEGDEPCETFANITFTRCMQSLVVVHE